VSVKLVADDNTLRLQFLALKTSDDLANLLDVEPRTLRFYLTKAKNYRTFEIKKRSGGNRKIAAPANALKIIQRKLNQVLQAVYGMRLPVHGFVRDRNVKTNASRHLGARWVVNFDLADFFPSIHFGRVRGLFSHKPYNLPHSVSHILAQICCHENALPAGSPSSPVVANMICAQMDSQLRAFAKRSTCIYTRYADDITLSTKKAKLDPNIAYRNSVTHAWALGDELRTIIETNKFKINDRKTRVRDKSGRQEVTGLRINNGLNVSRALVRQVRAMLHAWEYYGESAAEEEFKARYDHKQRQNSQVSFQLVLRGKLEFIGFVRGRTDSLYIKLLTRFLSLDEKFKARPIMIDEATHRDVIARAVWLLISTSNAVSGTAFAVEGGTLLTAAHCVETEMVAIQPSFGNKLFPVRVIRSDTNIDIAEIEIDAPRIVRFQVGNDNNLATEDQITVIGFPRYRSGDSVAVSGGKITHSRNYQGIPHFVINTNIVQGNSGGPILDKNN
jgi:RNA-directed DNA polymerase